VGELTGILGMAQSRVSGHLAVLREAGLVQDRRQGTSAFYSARPEGEASTLWAAVRDSAGETGPDPADRTRLAETLARREVRSREFFDRIASAWDGRSERLGLHAGGFALAGLLPEGLTVLDLGTGTGGFLPTLTRYAGRVLAVDLSRDMLERARQEGEGRAGLIRADAGRLPLPDHTMDGVVLNMILHHLRSPEEVLRETARVMKPGGRGVVVDFEIHDEAWLLEEEGHRWAGFSPAQIGSWCVDAGLSMPEFERVPTPESGRWSRLEVFVARFGRAATSARARSTGRS